MNALSAGEPRPAAATATSSATARTDYIFIVGLGRTGSTLTRTILNCSDDVGIGGESHFFRNMPRLGIQARRGFRQRLAKVGDITTDAGASQVVDFIFDTDQQHFNFWNLAKKQVDRDAFLRALAASDRSERALFDLAMTVHAGGKPIRGEKTPAHIFAVPTLLEWFPNAKIIHTFRDPRAIYVSNKKKAEKKTYSALNAMLRKLGLVFQFYASLQVIIPWLQATRLHRKYQELYPGRYYLSRYEDLIFDPARGVQRLCDFLGIEFTERMLQQTVVNSSYVPSGQVKGFDAAAVDRWRAHLHPLINRWFIFWCRARLLEFGYRP
jgi:hypothetical protein